MSAALVSTQPNPMDVLAADVVAGLEQEAQEEAGQAFFAALMAEVEVHPLAGRKYTAAHFFVRQPERFQMVVHYLARGIGVKRVSALCGCHLHTVQAVRDRFPTSVATEKERLADLCMTASTLLVETIIENPERVPPQSWALSAAQLADKALLLRGGPTMIVEKRHTFSHADFNRLIEGAIDVESECLAMGYGAGEKLANGAGAARPAVPAIGGPVLAEADSESAAAQRHKAAATRPATVTEPETGGEGVSTAEAGGLGGEAS